MSDISGKTALVTGASSGIGAEIARHLAKRGCNLVLTARRGDRLEALAKELSDAHSVSADVIAFDLGVHGAAAELHAKTVDKDISILVNNAGFGGYQHFEEASTDRVSQMIQLNVVSLAELCHLFVNDFRERSDQTYILNVGSMVAWMPIPYFATYCATKSFVRNFSECLAAQLKKTNVSVTCLSPGGTRTEFNEVSGQQLNKMADASLMSAERCAGIGVRAMLKKKRNVVSGFSNKLMCFLTRFVPRRLSGATVSAVLGKPQTRPEAAAKAS